MSHETILRRTSHGKVCAKSDRVCIAVVWYLCSIVVFILVAITAALAGERQPPVQADTVNQPVYEIASQFLNPTPSVRLKVTSAPWCFPCKRLRPILETLKERGYEIEIEELDSPNKPGVPYLEFFQFGQLSREYKGIPSGKDPRAFIVQTFEEIEGVIFSPRGAIRE